MVYKRYTAAKGAFIEQVLRARRSSIWPVLHYDDAAAAMNFLIEAFGVEQTAVAFTADRDVAHCELSWPEGGQLVFGSTEHAASGLGGTGSGASACYLVTEDVDAVHALAVEAGADVVEAPADTEFGTGVPTRAFSARDPEGNLWTFGTYRGA